MPTIRSRRCFAPRPATRPRSPSTAARSARRCGRWPRPTPAPRSSFLARGRAQPLRQRLPERRGRPGARRSRDLGLRLRHGRDPARDGRRQPRRCCSATAIEPVLRRPEPATERLRRALDASAARLADAQLGEAPPPRCDPPDGDPQEFSVEVCSGLRERQDKLLALRRAARGAISRCLRRIRPTVDRRQGGCCWRAGAAGGRGWVGLLVARAVRRRLRRTAARRAARRARLGAMDRPSAPLSACARAGVEAIAARWTRSSTAERNDVIVFNDWLEQIGDLVVVLSRARDACIFVLRAGQANLGSLLWALARFGASGRNDPPAPRAQISTIRALYVTPAVGLEPERTGTTQTERVVSALSLVLGRAAARRPQARRCSGRCGPGADPVARGTGSGRAGH